MPIHDAGREIFREVTSEMDALLNSLRSAPAMPTADHSEIPTTPGVYLFSKGDEALYVGQTRNLRTRLNNHTNPLSRENKASFAFLVAKTEARKAGVDLSRTRKVLEGDEDFARHFGEAKLGVAEMDVRFIQMEGAISRSIFEIYASLTLDTLLYNSFETH
ncbi:MAG: GIY-YIG nuclease family protein [Solirubrobacterales bacterium]